VGVLALGAFENAFTHAPIGMALVDLAGRVLRVNHALCRITGFTAEQVCARAFRDLSDPQDVDVDVLQIEELLDGRLPSYYIEKRYRHAWGHQVWVLLSVSLVRDDGGRPLNLIAQVQDISERKELEGRLEHLVDHDFLTALFNGRHFDLANNEISQYELLLRLRTEDGHLLPPSAFLYVAERFGTILAIDAWVVRQAVALIATQAKAGRPLTLNVNISAKSIGNPQLVAVIDRALADSRIRPRVPGLRADRNGGDRQHRPRQDVYD
jgi:PAS domain S-box-containing protein